MPKLDKRAVRLLPGPGPGRFDVVHWDDDLPGFGLRVLASGARSWVTRYRVGRRQRVVTLGKLAELDPADARRQARAILHKAGLGQDVRTEIAEEKARAAETLGSLAGQYLARYVAARQKPRTREETRRHLERHWAPLHGLPVHKVDRRRVAARLAELAAENGPVAANRARAALSALFAWAMREGLAEANPVVGTGRPAPEVARSRVLADEELALVWRATGGPGDYDAIVRLLLLTGQRREEVAAMRWRELDLARGLWSIPAERTKNGLPHDVPLAPAAVAVIETRARRDGRGLVFGEGGGGFSGWSGAKARLDQRIAALRAAAASRQEPGPGDFLEPWRLHDLRRTLVTGMAERVGIQPHVIEAVVNHVSGHKGGIAGVYNRATYAKEKRLALEAWGERVLGLVRTEKQPVSSPTAAC